MAVGERYLPYLGRLISSLLAQGKPADAFVKWSEKWPPGSPPHGDLHYAFKFHAVKHMFDQGCDEIMWLDAACRAVGDVTPVWEETARRGVYVVYGDTIFEPLGEWISDAALDYFHVTRDEAMKIPLCGGAVVGLDMRQSKAIDFFAKWGELVKTKLFMSAHSRYSPERMRSLLFMDQPSGLDGPVISEDPRVKEHRSDEACFALMLRELDVEPVPVSTWNMSIRTGYDL